MGGVVLPGREAIVIEDDTEASPVGIDTSKILSSQRRCSTPLRTSSAASCCPPQKHLVHTDSFTTAEPCKPLPAVHASDATVPNASSQRRSTLKKQNCIRIERSDSLIYKSVISYCEFEDSPAQESATPITSQKTTSQSESYARSTHRRPRKEIFPLPIASVRPPDAFEQGRRSNDEVQASQPLYIASDSDDEEDPFCSDDYLSDGEFQRVLTSPRHDPDDVARTQRRTSHHLPRNGPISAAFRLLQTWPYSKGVLRENKCVELKDKDFLRISAIVQNKVSNEVFLRGLRLRRTKDMNGTLLKKRNELCLVLEVDLDDARPPSVQSAEEVPMSAVLDFRRIIFTNQAWPKLSFNETEALGETLADDVVFNSCHLVCRWKLTVTFKDAKARQANHSLEKAMQALRREEADRGAGLDDGILRTAWRGTSTRGGAHVEAARALARPSGGFVRPLRRRPSMHSSPSSSRERGEQSSSFTTPGSQASSPINLDDDSPTLHSRLGQLRCSSSSRHQPQPGRWTTEDLQHFSVGFSTPRDWHSPDGSARTPESPLHPRRGSQNMTAATAPSPSTPTRHRKRRAPSIDLIEAVEPITPSSKKSRTSSIVPITPSSTGRRMSSGKVSSFADKLVRGMTTGRDAAVRGPPLMPSENAVHGAEHRRKHSLSSDAKEPATSRSYTFGDGFCGAGGASRGALMAGFHVTWGFDKDTAAVQSYCMNFPDTEVHQSLADQFVTGDNLEVDVLHLSPPCQTFSPAHTVAGKDDELNSASFFSIGPLLEKAKPRVTTLENTAGLPERHAAWSHAAIHMFTSLGFSVRWRIVNCAEYGAPQARRRFFLFASCPGEILPAFPQPTHSSDIDLQRRLNLAPLVTVNDAIGYIPEGTTHHDVQRAKSRCASAYDASIPLRYCVTTGGGGNYHPSGRRDLTNREFASLQSFPHHHNFSNTGVKRQIGNAVPPVVAKTMFEAVRKALKKADDADPFSS